MMGMHVEDGPNDYEKRMRERNAAMKKRLEKLPQNAVVQTATKRVTKTLTEKENRDKWEAVDSLVSAAYGQFCDGDLSFIEATKGLGEAISALAKGDKTA